MLTTKFWATNLRLLLVLAMLSTSCRFFRSEETPPPTDELPTRAAESAGLGSIDSSESPATRSSSSETTATASAVPTAAPQTTTTQPAGNPASLNVNRTDLSALPVFVAPDTPPPTFETALSRASQMAPLIGQLEAALDDSQFDLLAFNAAAGFEAGQLVAAIHSDIAFEQYPGVLRGPEGTLIGRAGNAVDQALLLRQLLDDAGYETRLARTTLTQPQAQGLVNQMTLPRPDAPPIGDMEQIRALTAQLAQLTPAGQPGELLSDADAAATVEALTATDSAVILDGMAAAGYNLDGQGILDALIMEAQDYFWVQYRLSSFDDWENAHPAFTDPASAPADLTPETTYRLDLPADLYHRIRLDIFIEQKFDEELRVYPLLDGWEMSSVDLVGQPITLQNQPNNLDFETATSPEQLLQEAGVFLPLINGELAPNAFDLDGRVFGAGLVSLDTVGMTELFQSAAAGAEGATSLLGDLGSEEQRNPDDLLTLTGYWIDYTMIRPDGSETTTRRYLLDRVGPENRAAGKAVITDETPLLQAAQALLNNQTIIVLPGEYSRAYVSSRILKRMGEELALSAAFNPDGTLTTFPENLITSIKPVEDAVLNGAFGYANRGKSSLRAYRAAPSLVVYEQGLVAAASDPTAFERVDVIHNARRVFDVSGGQVRPDPAAAVQLGVWETYAEGILLRGVDPGAVPDGNLKAIRESAAAGIPLQIIPPDRPDLLAQLPHSEETIASATRDLAAGYAIIIPEHPLTEEAPTGWWRVDPLTGETLGMATGGFGNAFVEYGIALFIGSLFAIASYGQCRDAGGSHGCCFAESLIWMSYGLILGISFGIAAAHISASYGLIGFAVGDIGLGIAGLFNPISLCH